MKKTLLRGALALALLLLLAAALMPASAQQVWKWSTTSATNSTADPAINWATGMAPSQVSPSSRAMMAAVARHRLDNAGRIATGGTSTAYTVTSNSSYAATPDNGVTVAFTPHTTNGASATLAVDGGTAFAIRTDASTAVPAATLVSGSPYKAVFNSTASAWILHGYYGSPTTIPIGGLIDYAGSTAPNSNFALANGQCISRTTYATLFALTSTTFGVCDGSTTFGLPDTRGRMIAGLDMSVSGLANRITVAGGNIDTAVLGATQDRQNYQLSVAQLPTHTPAGTISQITPAGTISQVTGSVNVTDPGHAHQINVQVHTTVPVGGANVAVNGNVPWGDPSYGNAGVSNSNTTGITASFTGSTPTFTGTPTTPTFTGTSIGSGSTHPIVPPFIVLGKLIRIF